MNSKKINTVIIIVLAALLVLVAAGIGTAIGLSSCTGNNETKTDGIDYSDVVLKDHIELGEYLGITLFSDSWLATNEEIGEAIDEIRAYGATAELYETPILDRGGVAFERIGIDYECYVDGNLIKTEKDAYVVLTEISRIFPEGFATGLIGVKPGEVKTMNLTLDDDKYIYLSNAGKPAKFVVTVKEIQGKVVLPELTDDFVKEASNGEFTTVKSYIQFFKDYIEGEKKQKILESNSDTMWNKIVVDAKVIEYPEKQVNYYYEENVNKYKELAKNAGEAYETFLEVQGITDDMLKRDAQTKVKKDLVYRAILEAEDIKLESDDFENGIKKYMDYYKMSREEILKEFTEKEIRESVLWDKTMEYLMNAQKFVVVENGVEYSAIDISALDFSKYITLGEYKGLTLTTRSDEYTDSELDHDLAALLESKAEYKKHEEMITDTSVVTSRGDKLNIDFVGYILGEPFAGGSAEGQEVSLLIDNGFIDGFASALYGKHIGEKVTAEVVFPEDYYEPRFRGVHATFEITINGIVGKHEIKELTDEYAKELSKDEFSTAEEFLADLRERKATSKKAVVRTERYDALLAAIKKNATLISYPEEQVMYYYAADFRYNESMANMYGVTVDRYLLTMNSSREALYASAQESALSDLIVQNLIKKENIVLTDEEYKATLDKLIEMTGMTEEKIKEVNGENFIEEYGVREKLIDHLIANSTLVFE